MTNEHREILQRINSYSENVLGEIDPQKVQVSMQLEKLKPIMEEISKENDAWNIVVKPCEILTLRIEN